MTSAPYVVLPENPLYTGSVVTKASIGGWFKFERKPVNTDKAHLIDARTTNGDAAFILWIDASNVMQFRFYSTNTGTFKYVQHDLDTDVGGVGYDATEEWLVDKWIHFMGTWETLASDTSMYLYANGKLLAGGVNHYTDPFSMQAAGNSPLGIGVNLTSATAVDDEYIGHLTADEIMIYNDILSGDEVLRNYNAGKRSHK